jgi:transporter family-2 protein
MAIGGALIAFQSPINAQLSRGVGVLEATLTSFLTGTVLMIGLVWGFGRGSLRPLITLPAWQWLGGLLGAGYVTVFVLSIPRLGVVTATVAALVGQLVTGMVIDHYGLMGVEVHPISWMRLAGVPLLFAALWLMQGGVAQP